MTDTTTEPTPEPAAEPDSSEEDRISRLESKVDRILDAIPGLSRGPQKAAGEPEEDAKSVAQREARQAVQDLQRREQAKQKRAAEQGELKALRDKVEKIVEKPPREYRKVEKFMRWDKDDK